MADIKYPLSAEDGHDDLPRTLRREKEARERERREREAKERGGKSRLGDARERPSDAGAAGGSMHPDYHGDPYDVDGPAMPAVVKQFDVPFLSLVMFFLKAVLAAIPALILLGVVILLIGEILQQLFPWLVKMQIFVHFPE